MTEVHGMDEDGGVGSDRPAVVPEPVRADPIEGELITEMFDYDGGRQVTVYLPPHPPVAVVFAGDGRLISQWGGCLEAADVPATMIVGAHRTDAEDETVRIREYSPSFDEDRFAAHERFFVDDRGSRWATATCHGRARFPCARDVRPLAEPCHRDVRCAGGTQRTPGLVAPESRT